MARIGWTSLACVGWMLVAACATLGSGPEDFTRARSLNLTDISSEAGKQYERDLCECVRREYANALNQCISALADPDLSSFEMIVSIEADG